MHGVTDAQDSHAELAFQVRSAVAALTWRMRAQRQEHGASGLSLTVLSRLYRAGTHTPGALAEAEGVQPQSLTRVLAALEKRGLVHRRRDPDDGRQSLIDITHDGLKVLRQDSRRREQWLAGALGELTPTERELLRLAAGLISTLAEHPQ